MRDEDCDGRCHSYDSPTGITTPRGAIRKRRTADAKSESRVPTVRGGSEGIAPDRRQWPGTPEGHADAAGGTPPLGAGGVEWDRTAQAPAAISTQFRTAHH